MDIDSLNNIFDTDSSYDPEDTIENIKFKKVGKSIKSGASKTVKTVKKGTSKTVKTVKKGTEKTVKTVKKGVEDTVDDVTDTFKGATKGITDMMNKAIKEVKEVGDKAVDGVEKAADKAVDGVKDAADSAVDGVKDVADKAKDGLEGFVDTAKDAIMDTVNKAFEGIKMIFDELLKIGRKILDFILGFEKYWNKFKDAAVFFNKPENVTAFILTVCIPFVGQLIARFMILNGSLDQPWLFLFGIPPLTLVPAFAMMFSFIKPTKGGLPWDSMVWLPIMGTVMGNVIARGHKSRHVFRLILSFGSFVLAYWYKTTKLCKSGYDEDKVKLDAIISYMFVIIFALILPYIPYIGRVISMIQAVVPQSDLFIQALAVFLVYVGTNIVNGSLGGHCRASIKEEDMYKVIFAAVCLTIVTAFSPGDVASMVMNMAQSQGMNMPRMPM